MFENEFLAILICLAISLTLICCCSAVRACCNAYTTGTQPNLTIPPPQTVRSQPQVHVGIVQTPQFPYTYAANYPTRPYQGMSPGYPTTSYPNTAPQDPLIQDRPPTYEEAMRDLDK